MSGANVYDRLWLDMVIKPLIGSCLEVTVKVRWWLMVACKEQRDVAAWIVVSPSNSLEILANYF